MGRRWTFRVCTVLAVAAVSVFAQDRKPSPGVDTFRGKFVRESDAPASSLKLWYRRPASNWNEALPIGNGRLGAMIFGGIEGERIQLNEDTLWGGSPYDPANPEALAALPEARRLVFAGRYKEAETLIEQKMMSKPLKQMPYQTVGDLRLAFPQTAEVSSYRRELDIDEAIARVTYTTGGITFTREIFASNPANAILIRLKADKPGAISFKAAYQSPQQAYAAAAPENTVILRGMNGSERGIEGKLRFSSMFRVIAQGGKVSNECGLETALSEPYSLANVATDSKLQPRSISINADNCVSVTGADSAILIVTAATAYKSYNDISGDEVKRSHDPLAAAARQGFEVIRKEHIADHQRYFRRVRLDLGETPEAKKTTNERIRDYANVDDPQLASLYFQFGRYLLIASSRPGTQPANLQGIWNDSMSPPWNSKYTVNINTEMNYWLAEPTGLSEMTDPLVAMVEDLSKTGSKMAKDHYGARGWVTHHNTDLWRATGPIDAARYGMWPTGGAWLTMHLWERYEYSKDKAFLARIYPILKEASLFFVDTLVEEPGQKWLVTNPSMSPENRHPSGSSIAAGPTMDQQIIRDLFSNTIAGAEILGRDKELRQQLSGLRQRLAPNRIGKGGKLQEWLDDWDEDAPDKRHRHVSHLYGAFPSWQINTRDTPELAEAVKKTLNTRGDETTGWAIAWRLNLWSRLRDAERANKILSLLIRPERTYANMFDAHPPFQIDGNFGGANGIGEMLMQNRINDGVVEIELLPALPRKFANGSFEGLRARHGFTVDAKWRDGKLTAATIRSSYGESVRIIYRGTAIVERISKGKSFQFVPREV